MTVFDFYFYPYYEKKNENTVLAYVLHTAGIFSNKG
jgi:hypothetical protein